MEAIIEKIKEYKIIVICTGLGLLVGGFFLLKPAPQTPVKETNLQAEVAAVSKDLVSEKEVNEVIIPSLFVVAIIFMLTQLFAERYQNHLDTAHLYPVSKVTFAISSLGVGVGYVTVLFIGICGFSFLVGSLISGFGQLDYPYPIYSLVNQEVTIGKIQDVLFPGLLLAFLAFIVIVEVVYLIAYFFKQKMPVLFLSLIGIVGLLFGIQTIQPLQRIAHLIPFTYLRSVEILSGRLSKQIDNVDLNWSMGMVLLPCLIILLLVGILFIERWGSSRKKEVFKV